MNDLNFKVVLSNPNIIRIFKEKYNKLPTIESKIILFYGIYESDTDHVDNNVCLSNFDQLIKQELFICKDLKELLGYIDKFININKVLRYENIKSKKEYFINFLKDFASLYSFYVSLEFFENGEYKKIAV